MIVCTACEGEGRVLAVLCAAGGGFWETSLSCPICRGEGELTGEQERRMEAGRRLRSLRLSRGLSQRQMAERMGVTVEELSRREVGLVEGDHAV